MLQQVELGHKTRKVPRYPWKVFCRIHPKTGKLADAFFPPVNLQASKMINLRQLAFCLPGVLFFHLNAILQFPWLSYQIGTVSSFPIIKHTFMSQVEANMIYFFHCSLTVASHLFFILVIWSMLILPQKWMLKWQGEERDETDKGHNMTKEILPAEDSATSAIPAAKCCHVITIRENYLTSKTFIMSCMSKKGLQSNRNKSE